MIYGSRRKKEELEKKRREDYTHPGMIKFLPEYIFRVSHPAVIGVRVLGGRIKVDMKLMDQDGKSIGSIKGMQSDNKQCGGNSSAELQSHRRGYCRQTDQRRRYLFTDIPEK